MVAATKDQELFTLQSAASNGGPSNSVASLKLWTRPIAATKTPIDSAGFQVE
jgi:hypothetical protein